MGRYSADSVSSSSGPSPSSTSYWMQPSLFQSKTLATVRKSAWNYVAATALLLLPVADGERRNRFILAASDFRILVYLVRLS